LEGREGITLRREPPSLGYSPWMPPSRSLFPFHCWSVIAVPSPTLISRMSGMSKKRQKTLEGSTIIEELTKLSKVVIPGYSRFTVIPRLFSLPVLTLLIRN